MVSGFLHRDSSRFLYFFLLILFVFISGCASGPARATFPKNENQPVKIALLSFKRVPPDESLRTVVCPLTGMIYRSCDSPAGTEQDLEKYFLEGLEPPYHRNLIPAERADGIYRRISSASFKTSQAQILKSLGEELNADAVLTGYLFCYRERVGYNYAAEKPASVAFGIYLVRVSDGTFIWKGVFDKTQKSLFEDVLQIKSFVREGGKWVPADVLLREGVEEVLKSFPELH